MSNQKKIGLMVVLTLIMLVVMIVRSGNFSFTRQGSIVKVQFKDIDGVNLNSPVMYNGYEVGVVKDIHIIDSDNEIKMELTIWLDDQAKLRRGAKAYVKNLGFMGEKYVGMTSGEKDGPYLVDGATIIGQDPTNFEQLVRDGQEIVDQMKEIAMNVNERLAKNKNNVDEILTNVNASMKNISSISTTIDERFSKNKGNVDTLLSNFNVMSTNLEELSYDLKLHPWKIMYRSKDKKE